MKKKIILGNNIGVLLLSFAGLMTSCFAQKQVGKDYSLAEKVTTIPIENRLFDKDWQIWCGSMLKGNDDKYHLYYSRWPRKTAHEGWISHSEIGHAVADKPEGPYRHIDIALDQTDSVSWDGATAHNPYIISVGKKYFLYYAGTQGVPLATSVVLKAYGQEWWTRRNTQQIGVAVSDSPNGPWKRFDKPVLERSDDSTAFDGLCVTNPAICVGRNGKIVMLYKAVPQNGKINGGKVRFSVAFADRPEGPFIKSNKLIFEPENPNDNMVAEDPYLWYDEKADKYFAIVRDVIKQFVGKESGGLALMVSDDAMNWKAADKPNVLPKVLHFSDGSSYDEGKSGPVERPWFYRNEKGVPVLLFGAFGIHTGGLHREHTFNGWIPFKL